MADLETTCWTCAPLEKYVEISQSFTDRLSDTLQGPIIILFASLCGLWIVVSGTKLHFHMTALNDVIREFIFVSIAALLLGGQGAGLISAIYSGALSIMGASSAAVFSLASTEQSSGFDGLPGLAANGEQAVAKVFEAAQAIVRSGSAFNIAHWLYAVVLVLPYFLLIVAYGCQVVVAIFRVTLIGVFAPFLFMAFAFGWGRGMGQSGAKTLLASILVLFASTAALSLTIYGVNSAINDLQPGAMSGDGIAAFASISNPDFLVILFLGWLGTALMTEGTSIANSIASTALTNAAAGIATAGVGGSVAALWKKTQDGAGGLGGLGKASHERLWSNAHNGAKDGAAENLVDKFKNANKQSGDGA